MEGTTEKRIAIGVITAVEEDAWVRRFGEPTQGFGGIWLYNIGNYDVFVVKSGVGRITAAATTQYLIDVIQVDVVINYGTVGALSPDLKPGKPLRVTKVADYQFDCSECDGSKIGHHSDFEDEFIPVNGIDAERIPALKEMQEVVCACGDKFIGNENEKAKIRTLFGADICDMESAAVAYTAFLNGKPCVIIKAISDTLTGGADEYEKNKESSSDLCVKAIERILTE